MSIDTKQLSEQNKIKTLLVTKAILDKKQQQIQDENRSLEMILKEEQQNMETACSDVEKITNEIRQFDELETKSSDER